MNRKTLTLSTFPRITKKKSIAQACNSVQDILFWNGNIIRMLIEIGSRGKTLSKRSLVAVTSLTIGKLEQDIHVKHLRDTLYDTGKKALFRARFDQLLRHCHLSSGKKILMSYFQTYRNPSFNPTSKFCVTNYNLRWPTSHYLETIRCSIWYIF